MGFDLRLRSGVLDIGFVVVVEWIFKESFYIFENKYGYRDCLVKI